MSANSPVVDPEQRVGLIAELVRTVRLIWKLFTDRRVPLWTKAILPTTLIYIVSPLDFIPDVIPVLGQLDDLAIALLGVRLFIDLCPSPVVQEHMQALLGESKWRVEPGSQSSSTASPPNPQVVDVPYEVKRD